MTISDAIAGQKYISLATFRKSGAPVRTPVWFGEANGKLYVKSRRDSGKFKRIRNNPAVKVAPCDVRGRITGPEFSGTARILNRSEEEVAKDAVNRKYWLARLPFWSSMNQYLEIELTS
jgi:PPOX class probable F420-dependent enzyme